MIRLRGHHLLCLHGFRGLGYSPEFVQNMQELRDLLVASPETLVKILDSSDDICAACPNLSDNVCVGDSGDREYRIRRKDRVVLKELSLIEGDVLPAGELFIQVAERFSIGIADICSSCTWFSLNWCAEGIRSRAMSVRDKENDGAAVD